LSGDSNFEYRAGNGSKCVVAADEKTFGVIAGYVFHVLAAETRGEIAVGQDHLNAEEAMSHGQPLGAVCAGDQLTYRTVGVRRWDGRARHSPLT
jgi:hypothetical protein